MFHGRERELEIQPGGWRMRGRGASPAEALMAQERRVAQPAA